MNSNSWFKSTFQYSPLGTSLNLDVPHDVFSTLRIDEGTLLLLNHLPSVTGTDHPQTLLDMGCGYGALGLPIARKYPDAKLDLVDRDLLAVAWSKMNAEKNGLSNVAAFGSLGFRDLEPSKKYDWILCNVPARIGKPFIHDLLESGRGKLTRNGELRIVVITDLEPIIDEINREHALEIKRIAKGPRHTIFQLSGGTTREYQEPSDLYLRDHVQFAGLRFDRPFDLGGDDPKRLTSALPLLMDALPRRAEPQRVFCFRNAYGIVPVLIRKRWPNAQIVTCDRDLLGTTFIRRNAIQHSIDPSHFQVIESDSIANALREQPHPFDLIVGEISSSAGEKVAKEEVETFSKSLTPHGQAVIVCLDKLLKEWFGSRALISRDGFSILPSLS